MRSRSNHRWGGAVLVLLITMVAAVTLFGPMGRGRASATAPLSFTGPTVLSFGPHETLYVSDDGGTKELTTEGELLRTLHIRSAVVDRASGVLYGFEDAIRRGNSYVGEIKKFSPTGRLIARFFDRRFLNAQMLAVGGRGNLFLAVRVTAKKGPGSRVYKLTPHGAVLSSWSVSNGGYDFIDVTAGVLDRSGNVYFSMAAGSCSRGCQGRDAVVIEKFSPAGKRLFIWRLSPQTPLGRGLGVDGDGNVVIAGFMGIEKLSPGGHILFQVGSLGCGPLQFKDIEGLAIDDGGSIYVSDQESRNIHKLSRAATPLALWGGCPPSMPPTPVLPTPRPTKAT